MARWTITRTESGVALDYKAVDKPSYHCGTMRADTPTALVFEWVMKIGEARLGDAFVFPDGRLYQLQPAPRLTM